MTFCYTRRAAYCSAIIREASSCSGWEQTQRPTARQNARSERPQNIQSIQYLPSRNPEEEEVERESQKIEDTKKKGLLNTAWLVSRNPTANAGSYTGVLFRKSWLRPISWCDFPLFSQAILRVFRLCIKVFGSLWLDFHTGGEMWI